MKKLLQPFPQSSRCWLRRKDAIQVSPHLWWDHTLLEVDAQWNLYLYKKCKGDTSAYDMEGQVNSGSMGQHCRAYYKIRCSIQSNFNHSPKQKKLYTCAQAAWWGSVIDSCLVYRMSPPMHLKKAEYSTVRYFERENKRERSHSYNLYILL